MNTNGLAKHYNKLTPWERVPLIIAAGARGDETEQERLARSAPRNLYRVSDFRSLSDGLHALADFHMMTLLDLAAIYWQGSVMVAESPPFVNNKEARQQDDRLWQLLKMLAYRFVVNADGWKLFCGELGIDPDALLTFCPGYDTITRMEKLARPLAFTQEEAIAWLRQKLEAVEAAAGRTRVPNCESRIETAKDVARGMREALERQAES